MDEMRVQQVLINLLSNAIKFSVSDDKVTVKVDKKLKEDSSVDVSVSVIDKGIGIKEDDLKNLFKAYYKTNDQ